MVCQKIYKKLYFAEDFFLNPIDFIIELKIVGLIPKNNKYFLHIHIFSKKI